MFRCKHFDALDATPESFMTVSIHPLCLAKSSWSGQQQLRRGLEAWSAVTCLVEILPNAQTLAPVSARHACAARQGSV
jgi:hypothetical protein